MLRLDNEQPSLWASVLPPELFEMSEELAKIDRYCTMSVSLPLSGKVLYHVGGPTMPVATYFLMMCLKRGYKLGY